MIRVLTSSHNDHVIEEGSQVVVQSVKIFDVGVSDVVRLFHFDGDHPTILPLDDEVDFVIAVSSFSVRRAHWRYPPRRGRPFERRHSQNGLEVPQNPNTDPFGPAG